MKWSDTFLIWLRKSVGNRRTACYAQSTIWEEFRTDENIQHVESSVRVNPLQDSIIGFDAAKNDVTSNFNQLHYVEEFGYDSFPIQHKILNDISTQTIFKHTNICIF